STVAHNAVEGGAAWGGGIRSDNGSVAITSSVIADNSATAAVIGSGNGGGIFVSSGSFMLSQSIVSGNQADNGGGVLLTGGNGTDRESFVKGQFAGVDRRRGLT